MHANRRVFLAATVASAALLVIPASAGDGCTGVVRGLSSNYNPATGSGFLAVRAGPTTSATQIGELFNGDRVTVVRRQGNWYRISGQGMNGWAYAKYIRNSCGW